jgi:hypothetical protein
MWGKRIPPALTFTPVIQSTASGEPAEGNSIVPESQSAPVDPFGVGRDRLMESLRMGAVVCAEAGPADERMEAASRAGTVPKQRGRRMKREVGRSMRGFTSNAI